MEKIVGAKILSANQTNIRTNEFKRKGHAKKKNGKEISKFYI